MALTVDFIYIGICLEGVFYGLYSGIFAVYLQHHISAKGTYKFETNILFYALCVLYFLSLAIIVLDVTRYLIRVNLNEDNILALYYLDAIQIIVFGFCDFIAQSILIYRCWVMWGQNICVVIIPSILAFTFLVTWIVAGFDPVFVKQGIETSVALSTIVNALVTCLTVVRIFKFKVFREVKLKDISYEEILGITSGRKLQSIIFILIESGMALFSVQLARLVVTVVSTAAAADALGLIGCIYQMLNGITPTIILVRVSMGLSFYDKISMVEAAGSKLAGSSHFAPGYEDSILEICQEKRDDVIEIKSNDDMNYGEITDEFMVEAVGSLHYDDGSGYESSILEICPENRDDVIEIKSNHDMNHGEITDEFMVEAIGSWHYDGSGYESSILEICPEKRDYIIEIKSNNDITDEL